MRNEKGFVAIYTVLVVLAVVLAIAAAIWVVAISQTQGATSLALGEETLGFVEGCMEDGLLKARASSTFGEPVGTPVTITRPEGMCQVTVNSKVGSTWTMTVTNSTNPNYVRTVRTVFDRTSLGIGLTSWQEL